LIILGIDPGSLHCGYGILELEKRRIVAAGADVVSMPAKMELASRLVLLHEKLSEILVEYKPDVAAVESIFYGKNIKSAFTLGHARGVILLALAQHKIPITEYSPKEIKRSVVGNGNASKEQVEYMVKKMLKLEEDFTSHDASDALAIAICHYNKEKFKY